MVECAVTGVPNSRWGEAVTAVVVPTDPGAAPAEVTERVLAHCREHLGGFQVPQRVHLVDAMPKTATGEVQKADLQGSSGA